MKWGLDSMTKKIRRTIAIIIATMVLASMFQHISFAAGDFVPAAKTAYATEFINKCESQQWFMNEVESILNVNQKTINTLNSANDLNAILSIGLQGRNITGKIPKAIGELKELRTLFLSGNNLSGEIPAELFDLPKLYNVDISYNNYTNSIPSGFGDIASLSMLDLSGNSFTGTIPDDIMGNMGITFLDVSSNNLSGPIPSKLGNMINLVYLAISDNPWTKDFLPGLSGLTELRVFSAWGCNIEGQIPYFIYEFTELEVLDLSDNAIYGELPATIGIFGKLQVLALGRNKLTGTIPFEITSMYALSALDLSDNFLRGHVPASVANVANVYMENNYLTGTVMKGLANNAGNFCDTATTTQYQLIATSEATINKTTATNIYPLLKNKNIVTGNTTEKPVLSVDSYEVSVLNDSTSKIELTVNSSGIHVKAADEVLKSEGIKLEIMIKDNTGSDYSKVTILLTTEATSVGGSVIGGGTDPASGTMHNPYINGYPGGTFGPERSITREEIATMLIRALELDDNLSITEASFSDVDTNRWSAAFIEKAKDMEYVTGYPDGTFAPGNPMTRAELATCLVRIQRSMDATFPAKNVYFSDVFEDTWYYEYVREAAARGIVTGYEDGSFRPSQTVTRTEAVTMINRMLRRDPLTAPELSTATCPFSDVVRTHWGYLQILEASLTHEH